MQNKDEWTEIPASKSDDEWTEIPVDSKKKESSVGSLTGSESTTPLQSTSTSEIPTVQITDGEIDAAPLNRPSTMPYGVKMDDEGKIMADTDQDRKKRLSDQNRVKRIEFLKQKTAQNFKDNPELYSDPKNRDNYYNTLLKYYKPEDVAEIAGDDREFNLDINGETVKYRPNIPSLSHDPNADPTITHDDYRAIKHPINTISEATRDQLLGAKEKIVKAHETLSPLPQDQLKAGLGMTAGLVQGAMGIGNIIVPEFAAFTLGTKQAEESLPIVNKVMAPLASGLESYYKDSGKQPPSWMGDAASLGDFAWNMLLFKGAMKAGKKLSFADVDKAVKSMSPSDIEAVASKISEKHNTAEATALESTVPKMPEDAGELFKQNDVAMEEANNLSSQAETLKADLEKAKGTPAEPIIAQKIEELNTKIDEIHNNEVEKQTAEAHTLSTLDHLQKQREQLVATKESLSPEGQKALEPEIQKVDDMIKEISPKEEAKEVIPDNEVKETAVEGLMNKVAERKPTDGHYGSGENVKFTDNVAVPFRYKLVEADQLQPSHLASGERNPDHQISLAQPKERNDAASKQAQDKIAANPNLAEVGEGPNAFFGAPIVNKAGEVIQGNNRSIGLKKHYKQKGSSYKSQLAENAEKFGLTKDQVDGMENPVLVREVAVDDNTSVQLGNFDVKDLETGGKQRIDPIVTARKMTPENKSSLSSIVFDGDYKTVKEAIRSNVSKVAEIVKKYLNPAQFAKAFNKVGEITESGMDDIASVVNHFLFDKGDPVLPEAFSQIPDVIQKGLQKSLKYIMGTPEGKSILPETQNAVLAIYEWKQSGVADFNEWAAQTDMFKGVTPKDILSPLEFELAKKLSEAKNQSDISKVFAEYNDLVSDKPADMFNDATPGLSHNDAVKKQFKLSDYERTENKSKGHTETQGTEIPVDVTPKEVSGEKAEPAKGPEEIKDGIPDNESVEPTRQLGTGANVYFETDKYRVNDNLKNGKVLLNVGDAKGETPLRNIEFNTPEEAVFVAKKLQENAPNGLDSDFHNIDKIIENYKKEYRDSKSEASEPIAESKGVEEVNPDKGEVSSINDQLGDSPDYGRIKESVKESDSNKFRELQETTSESVKQKRMDNLSPEELHIEKNYGEIIKQLKASGLLKGPCI